MADAIKGYEHHLNKSYRQPDDQERAALSDLKARLVVLQSSNADTETIQTEVYSVGKEHDFDPLRAWFGALYETLLGQSQGPRFGSFVEIYGVEETITLIDSALDGKLAK